VKQLLTICLLIAGTVALGQDLTGDQIIQRVNEKLNTDMSHSIVQMTTTTTEDNERTFVYESWSKDEGEKSLIRYQEPRRIQGQAVLMLNNAEDIWMYFPRTDRVRKMATHAKKQNMQGSDFTYEDMGGGDSFVEDFSANLLTQESMEGYECYKLELIRKEGADISYSRIVMWVIQDNYIPVVIDYYSEDDPDLRIKRLVQKDIKTIDGIPTAMTSVMNDLIDNTSTSMKIQEIEYDISLNDAMFTERELKQ
jgi:outer membrane lipoprotein-sorting protein